MLKSHYLGRAANFLPALYQRLKKRSIFSNPGNYPKRIYVELTSACPLSCPMCPRTFMSRKVSHMPVGLVEKLADELYRHHPQWPKLTLHGFGEAVCHPQLLDILKILKRKLPETHLSVSLNLASAKPEDIDILFEGGIGEIGVWLDGATKETYKKQRAGGDFEKTVRTLESLIQKKEKSAALYPLLHVGMVVTQWNVGEINAFADRWKQRLKKMRGVSVRTVTGHNFNGKIDDSMLLRPRKEWFVFSLCNKPFEEALILADGRICICCHDAEGESAVGNLQEISLAEAWKLPRMTELRQQFLNYDYRLKMCKDCEIVKYYPIDGRVKKKEYLRYEDSLL